MVYIKGFAGDDGTRPFPAGTAFYLTPSIWLSDSATDPGPPPGGGDQATIDDPANLIHVRVDNPSAAAVNGVFVQAWVGNPTVSLQPDHALAGSNAYTPWPLGQTGQTVPAQGFTIVLVPWKPAATGLPPAGPYHLCIGANCYVVDPATGGDVEGVTLSSQGASSPYHPDTDPHMGQRNITLSAAPTGGHLRFLFQAANTRGEDTTYTLAVTETLRDDSLDLLGLEQVLGLPSTTVTGLDLVEIARLRTTRFCDQLGQPLERALIEAGGRPILVDSDNTYEVHPATVAARTRLVSTRLTSGADKEGDRAPQVLVPVGAVVPVALDIALPDETGPGGVHTFQLQQYDPDGTLVGGIQFMAMAATDEFLDPCRCDRS